MFDFSHANKEQREAISHIKGPLLITAGPGTGKTFTLVQRTIYLIEELHINPENIMIATFTEKAAKEIITRITNELMAKDISININDMYIGTFHSICLRIIKEHLEYTQIRKNYRILDSFDQEYMIFQNMFSRFNNIENIDVIFKNSLGSWKKARDICYLVNTLNEELVNANDLITDSDIEIAVAGRILNTYNKILSEANALDFSSIQTEAYRMLKNNPDILSELQEQIQYIMVDEYQDTNFIQEQIVFLIGGKNQNITVVGDDDQGLYRFRGATIRNILEFPNKFRPGACKQVSLVTNYRSDSKIVDFYNEWIETTKEEGFEFKWDKFRYSKRILPFNESNLVSPSVVKVSSKDNEEEWHKRIYRFIKHIEKSGKLKNLNQIAFLFNSVKNENAKKLAKYLEKNGINIYSPRSDMFFERNEIKRIIGCLLLCFPNYIRNVNSKNSKEYLHDIYKYYEECVSEAVSVINNPEYIEFKK